MNVPFGLMILMDPDDYFTRAANKKVMICYTNCYPTTLVYTSTRGLASSWANITAFQPPPDVKPATSCQGGSPQSNGTLRNR